MEVLQWLRQRNRIPFLLLIFAAFVCIAGALVLRRDKPVIPASISSQAVSTIFVPKGDMYRIDSASAKYDAPDKLLTFKITSKGKSVATFAEQPTPDQFVDIPESAPKFFQQAGEYKVFASNYGTVHLLHLGKSVNNAAAMNAQGTLLFVNPSIKFSEDDWRRLFKQLVVLQ